MLIVPLVYIFEQNGFESLSLPQNLPHLILLLHIKPDSETHSNIISVVAQVHPTSAGGADEAMQS